MKFFLLIVLILSSFDGYSDQSNFLAKGRDHFIDIAIDHLKHYCSDFLPGHSLDSTYICRLQIEEDCSRPSEKQKTACDVLKKVKDLENKISLSNRNINQLEPLPLYSSKTIIEKPDVKHAETLKPVYKQITVARGSSASNTQKNPESLKDAQQIDDMVKKINSLKIRLDCSSDSDCKIQEFGRKICGGPVGTFVYSLKGEENKVLQEEITKFNEADGAFIKKWNKDVFGTCDWNGRSEPAKCVDQVCS